MREIQIVQWCDMCESGDEQLALERSPATQCFTVGIIAGETQRPELHLVDVCDVHAKTFVELAALMQRLPHPTTSKSRPGGAEPVAPAKQPARKVPCPVCHSAIDKVSLVSHVWSNHRNDRRPESPIGKCPDCSKTFDQAQGLALHRKFTHQHSALIDVLSGVKGYKVTGREDDL